MSLLALDIGRRVGWARSGQCCGELALTGFADDADAYIAFGQWLADQLSENRPEAVLIERAFFTSRMRDADFTIGLIRVAHMMARMHDVPRRELAARSVRKAIFGQASGVTDAQRVERIRAMGWKPASNHEADAVALLLADQMLQAAA